MSAGLDLLLQTVVEPAAVALAAGLAARRLRGRAATFGAALAAAAAYALADQRIAGRIHLLPREAVQRVPWLLLPALAAAPFLRGPRPRALLGWLGLAALAVWALLPAAVRSEVGQGHWSRPQAALCFAGVGAALVLAWSPWTEARVPAASILAVQCAVAGGAVACGVLGYSMKYAQLAAALGAIGGVGLVLTLPRTREAVALGFGVPLAVGLASLIVLQRFYGRVSSGAVLLLLLAWLTAYVARHPRLEPSHRRRVLLPAALALAVSAAAVALAWWQRQAQAAYP